MFGSFGITELIVVIFAVFIPGGIFYAVYRFGGRLGCGGMVLGNVAAGLISYLIGSNSSIVLGLVGSIVGAVIDGYYHRRRLKAL